MSTRASKGLKPFAIKTIIIVMSVLYMLGPNHIEVGKLLHALWHNIEIPNTVLVHQDRSDKITIHETKAHKKTIVQHNHEVIELVEKILKGVENGSTLPESSTKRQKIDKHLSVHEVLDQEEDLQFLLKARQSILEIDNKLCKGFPHGFREPPQA